MTLPDPASAAEALPIGAPVPHVALPKKAHVLRRALSTPTAVLSALVLLLIVLVSLLADVLTSSDPQASSLANTLGGAAPGHPLGFDTLGRDVAARLLHGGRSSLSGAFVALAVALLVGVPAGVLAGYRRSTFDAICSWVANLTMSTPGIIILLIVGAEADAGITATMAVLGVLLAPGVYRLVRSSVLAVREELYVDAARVAGLSDVRIMRRHIVPVVSGPVVVQAAQLLGVGIAVQAGLQFLGIGGSEQVSWGAMLNDAFQSIYQAPRLLIWPSLAIILTIVSFALLGNGLRDALLGGDARPGRRARRAAAEAAARRGGPVIEGDRDPAASVDPGVLLRVEALRVAYPRPDGESVVVDGVSLTVRKGEVLGLVGESGSGKTQTAFAVLGLLPPQAHVTAAAIEFDGQSLTGLSQRQLNDLRGRGMAYIPQEPMSNLDPSFRIGYQLTEPMRHHLGLSKGQARERALELLGRVGIPDPARTFAAHPHEISGGMAQRVLIAGAVSCDPQLLIADEPTTALDVTVQAEVLDLLRSLQAERHMGVILVTHDFGVVADLCDRVAVMQTGRVVEEAAARTLFADPQHPYTRMLLDSTLEDTPARRPLAAAAPSNRGRRT